MGNDKKEKTYLYVDMEYIDFNGNVRKMSMTIQKINKLSVLHPEHYYDHAKVYTTFIVQYPDLNVTKEMIDKALMGLTGARIYPLIVIDCQEKKDCEKQ